MSKLLSRQQLATEKGLPNSKTHLYRAEHEPDPDLPFPRPVRQGRRVFWLEFELDAYIAALAARRGGIAA